MNDTQSWCNHHWDVTNKYFENLAHLASTFYIHEIQTDAFDYYVDKYIDHMYWGEV
jgi:hypothetical protein